MHILWLLKGLRQKIRVSSRAGAGKNRMGLRQHETVSRVLIHGSLSHARGKAGIRADDTGYFFPCNEDGLKEGWCFACLTMQDLELPARDAFSDRIIKAFARMREESPLINEAIAAGRRQQELRTVRYGWKCVLQIEDIGGIADGIGK